MPSKTFAALASAALLVTSSACSTATDQRLASDTAPSRDRSSWCQGDATIRYTQADSAGQNDPGNTLDTDKTVTAIQEHNARYRAACPDDQP